MHLSAASHFDRLGFLQRRIELARGDHLKVKRYGLYEHHGIDLGDGRVVHFGEPGKDASLKPIRLTGLDEFRGSGACIKVVPYAPGKALDPEESVRLALAGVDQKGYNLVFNNCEHFATFCKTGRKNSRQVWRAALGLSASAAAVVLAVGIKLIKKRKKH